MTDFSLLSPRHQLAEMLARIYQQNLTTTSGGNLSILDADGSTWITPGGVDKGTLTLADIVRVLPDGTVEGRHAPSSELPFHRMIYAARPDLKALVHAHPPALVAFSIVRQIPETCISPQSAEVCGRVGYAPYAVPGSEALGRNIADTFGQGFNAVLLENHGIVTGGTDLLDAFQRFETLEFSAEINIRTRWMGPLSLLTDEQIALFSVRDNLLPEFEVKARTSRELELRLHICEIVHRAYARRLMISTGGTVSARVDDRSFVITPYGVDRKHLDVDDIVLVRDGRREAGRVPSRAVHLHEAIYARHADIGSILTAQPPNATVYGILARQFPTRTIPESYVLLRDMPIAPYGDVYQHPERIAELVSPVTPVVLLQNDAVLTTGATVLEAFDRLEVAEFSAQALIYTLPLGEVVPINEEDVVSLKRRFKLK